MYSNSDVSSSFSSPSPRVASSTERTKPTPTTEKKRREIHNMVERMRRLVKKQSQHTVYFCPGSLFSSYRMSACIASIAERIPNLGNDKLDKSRSVKRVEYQKKNQGSVLAVHHRNRCSD